MSRLRLPDHCCAAGSTVRASASTALQVGSAPTPASAGVRISADVGVDEYRVEGAGELDVPVANQET